MSGSLKRMDCIKEALIFVGASWVTHVVKVVVPTMFAEKVDSAPIPLIVCVDVDIPDKLDLLVEVCGHLILAWHTAR